MKMALFCTSCQRLSRLISRRSRSIEDFSGIVSMMRPVSRRNASNIINNGTTTALLKSKELLKQEWCHSSSMLSVSSTRAIYTFPKLHSRSVTADSSKVNGQKEDKQKAALEKENEDDLTEEERQLLKELEEEGLTEEERQVLRELEEEERYLKEGVPSEDYTVWEGDVGTDKLGQGHLSGSVSEEYVHFENQQRIIQDVIDEVWNPLPQQLQKWRKLQFILVKNRTFIHCGKTGVFDLGELVDLLYDENADEVVAITLPKEIDYADWMVIVTVGSDRQLLALATLIRRRFKFKERRPTDKLPFFDKSVKHHGWIALDLGNIILHIFLPEIRNYYDLETLWTVGPVFDDLSNAKDPEIIQLLNTLE